MYFSATWCGPCKVFKPVVQEVSSTLGVPVNYIDVDQQPGVTQQYSVSAVPTIIVEQNGTVVHRSSGVMSKQQLTQILSRP